MRWVLDVVAEDPREVQVTRSRTITEPLDFDLPTALAKRLDDLEVYGVRLLGPADRIVFNWPDDVPDESEPDTD